MTAHTTGKKAQKAMHTPTPWVLSGWNVKHCEKTKGLICRVNNNMHRYIEEDGFAEAEANARHIVKCVNCHDELVEALKKCGELIERIGQTAETPSCISLKERDEARLLFQQALAKAQEE